LFISIFFSSPVIILFYAIPKKKDPEAYFRQAEERGAKEDIGIVNDNPVLKLFEDGTKKNRIR
jgi:hypothetical protein